MYAHIFHAYLSKAYYTENLITDCTQTQSAILVIIGTIIENSLASEVYL